jgi:hypothetical protein
MKTDKRVNVKHKTSGSDAVLRVLDSLLADSGQKRLTGSQATVILDALASSNDLALVVWFPVVLCICTRNGVSLNSHALFSKYWESSPKKQNLEKLLLLTDELFDQEGIEAPHNMKKIVSPLRPKYGTLLSSRVLSLSSGLTIPIGTVQNILRDYTAKITKAMPAQEGDATGDERKPFMPEQSAALDASLDRLFSPKQKDLIYKRLNSVTFTKTEREYYSRIVRKKLLAIANAQVNHIAIKLTQK